MDKFRSLLHDTFRRTRQFSATGLRRHPAQAKRARGAAQDFRIDASVHGAPMNLFGIESPGLTSALAIADYGRHRLM
jgi:L-2-hydroxyglutarate oxidase LhgO